MTETEVKLRWQGTAEAAQALIEQHGYQLSERRMFEANQLFDLPSRVLQQSDQILACGDLHRRKLAREPL